MSNVPSDNPPGSGADDLRPEYRFDYREARPNRFAASFPPGGRLVVLDPDIARVFTTEEAVNSVLRAIIAAMPPTAPG